MVDLVSDAARNLPRVSQFVRVCGSKPEGDNPFAAPNRGTVNRPALLARHSPKFRHATGAEADLRAPLQVGNGNFAFTADFTGLQTFPDAYAVHDDAGAPIGTLLGTMSSWGWHSVPFDHLPGVAPGTPAPSIEVSLKNYHTATADGGQRSVPYVDLKQEQWGGVTGEPDIREEWLRNNPHRLDLGRIGFWMEGGPITPAEVTDIVQKLDLATGLLTSEFSLRGCRFKVETAVAPGDNLAIRIHRVSGSLVSTGSTAEPASKPPAPGRLSSEQSERPSKPPAFGIDLAFPYGSQDWGNAQDWSKPESHTTILRQITYPAGTGIAWETLVAGPTANPRAYYIERTLDETKYSAVLRADAGWVTDPVPIVTYEAMVADREGVNQGLVFELEDIATAVPGHRVRMQADGDRLDVAINFHPEHVECCPADDIPGATADLFAWSASTWATYWERSAMVSFDGTADPRAAELERRIVLSQYLIAVNSAGDTPPAETGLMLNSWRGKFHLEMHYWHAANLPIWGHPAELKRSLDWYVAIHDVARATAERQGYQGVRWPKQTDPSGIETPSSIGTFLIWQQPHPIFLAELVYRAEAGYNKVTNLRKYAPLVKDTAEFMASFAQLQDDGFYHLPAPLVPAQESYARNRAATCDPTFELAYWAFGLHTAATWFERLAGFEEAKTKPPASVEEGGTPVSKPPASVEEGGTPVSKPLASVEEGGTPVSKPRDLATRWRQIANKMWRPQPKDLPGHPGVYPAIAAPPYTIRTDHPSMLAALGVVPAGDLIDPSIMATTLADITDTDWEWESTWGWDYPMGAMTATRLGLPDVAIDWLLLDKGKNEYLANGHNYQTPALPIYLPGNGGLLNAIGLMAGGWDGGPQQPAPGFPADWQVQSEGFIRLP